MRSEDDGSRVSWYIVPDLPWYELDRMIMVSIGTLGWVRAAYVVAMVAKLCDDRGVTIPEEGIFHRVLQLRELGSVSLGGSYTQLAPLRSEVRHSIHD